MEIWMLLLIPLVLAVMVWGFSSERRSWNGGYCQCGERWRRFDIDSQGGRGYVCLGCNQRMWISYPFIDRDYTDA